MSIENSIPYSNRSNSAFTANTARRVVEADVEPVPLAQLVENLRKMINGKHEQVCEARFDEVLEILAEQKGETETRVETLATSIVHLTEDRLGVDKMLGSLNEKLIRTSKRLDDVEAMEKFYEQALVDSRQEFEVRIDSALDKLHRFVDDFAMRSQRGTNDVAGKLAAHMAEDEKNWMQEREHSLITLEQRIAQWRAEIEDKRKSDMEEVANSIISIGERMMALRGN